MRAMISDLPSPYPLGDTLPALYAADDLAQSLCAAVDDVLAPIFGTLSALPAYLDPDTTPEDMLGWLGGWLGLTLDQHQPIPQQRAFIRSGIELYRWRGTARGIRDAVAAVFGATPLVLETGGSSFSEVPGGELPGQPSGRLVVRLPVEDPEEFDVRRLESVVAAMKPAHVPHEVDVVALGSG